MSRPFWSFAASYSAIVPAAVAVAVAVWMAIRAIRNNPAGKTFFAVEMLRLLIVGMLVFTLFRPEFVTSWRNERRPLVAVLTDGSASMSTRDVLAGDSEAMSRSEWVAARMKERFWEPMSGECEVVFDNFSATPTNDTAGTEPAGTDINAALRAAANAYDNLRAVLLLSDGDWTDGVSPVSAATELRARRIPVYAVTVGSDSYLPDIELENVRAPSYGLMDERIAVPFSIRSRLDRDVAATIALTGPLGHRASKEIRVPAMSRYQDSVLLEPLAPGDFTFNLSFPVQPGEVFSDNNSRRFAMSLRNETLKVLLVESVPRWEYRFLHNALSRDPAVEVTCCLFHPGMQPGGGKDYIPAFPGGADQLSAYDVVFLGDVGLGGGQLTGAQAEMIAGLVREQGSGLVFLPGRLGNQSTLRSSALNDLLPVETDSGRPAGYGFGLESRPALTASGRDHLLTMLAGTPAENETLWKTLPGFFWHAPVVKSKPGRTVLAVHDAARNEHGRIPLLVTGTAGNGKVLFMGTDSAWRWRRGVEDTFHYRFWSQVVRWMAHQRHMAHGKGIRFFYSPESPMIHERVFLHATVFDRSGYPLKRGEVSANIEEPGGGSISVDLVQESAGWGVFKGAFTPRKSGIYQIGIACDQADRSVSAQLEAREHPREIVGRPARSGVMREVAALTLGSHAGTDDMETVLRQLELMPESKDLERRLKLWCSPFWAAAIIALLAAYWTARKLLGVI